MVYERKIYVDGIPFVQVVKFFTDMKLVSVLTSNVCYGGRLSFFDHCDESSIKGTLSSQFEKAQEHVSKMKPERKDAMSQLVTVHNFSPKVVEKVTA